MSSTTKEQYKLIMCVVKYTEPIEKSKLSDLLYIIENCRLEPRVFTNFRDTRFGMFDNEFGRKLHELIQDGYLEETRDGQPICVRLSNPNEELLFSDQKLEELIDQIYNTGFEEIYNEDDITEDVNKEDFDKFINQINNK